MESLPTEQESRSDLEPTERQHRANPAPTLRTMAAYLNDLRDVRPRTPEGPESPLKGFCSICQVVYTDVSRDLRRVVQTPCGHLFHYSCLLDWNRGTNTCPLCRTLLFESNPLSVLSDIRVWFEEFGETVTAMQRLQDENNQRLSQLQLPRNERNERDLERQNLRNEVGHHHQERLYNTHIPGAWPEDVDAPGSGQRDIASSTQDEDTEVAVADTASEDHVENPYRLHPSNTRDENDSHINIPAPFLRALRSDRHRRARTALEASAGCSQGLLLSREVLDALTERYEGDPFFFVIRECLAADDDNLQHAFHASRMHRMLNVLGNVPSAFDSESICGLWISPRILRALAEINDDDTFAAVLRDYIADLKSIDCSVDQISANLDISEVQREHEQESGIPDSPYVYTGSQSSRLSMLNDDLEELANNSDLFNERASSEAQTPAEGRQLRGSLAGTALYTQTEADRLETLRNNVMRDYIYVAELENVERILHIGEEASHNRYRVWQSRGEGLEGGRLSKVLADAYVQIGKRVILFKFR